ncbi:MAG: rRNA pseudouridine synthase [Deltaproteobacteria bacterium]|nr:rRNA pseudouridine synthase [Deltaproteobacteria bacterium]
MARKRIPKWLVAASQHPGGLPPGEKPDWISRVLTRAGAVTPAELTAALDAGRATINGKPARAPLTLARATDDIRFDGQPVSFRPPTRVIVFHKPANTICTASDPDGHRTVYEALAPALTPELARYGWHCVGRLDLDTTGLLLFTNDERFVGHATSPASHLPKRYLATVAESATDAQLEPIRRGIDLHDGPARPAKAALRAPGLVELTLSEGRNHQVKRMLGGVGLPVRALHREAVGALVLDVPVGQCRELSAEEIRVALRFEPSP